MRGKHRSRSLVFAIGLGVAATFGATDAGAVRNPMLQALMKKVDHFTASGNLRATSEILNVVKSMGPEEFERWPALAERGRAAAAAGDSVTVKAVCRDCHDQYRDQYRTKYGSKAPDGKGPPEKD
jgi:hypothetical protein